MATPDRKPIQAIHPFGGSFSEKERIHHIYNPDYTVYSTDWNPAMNPEMNPEGVIVMEEKRFSSSE